MNNDWYNSSNDVDEMIEDLKKQMKKLDSKIIGYAYSWVYESLTEVLFDQFQVNVVSLGALSFKLKKPFEVDVLAYSTQEVYVVRFAEVLNNEHLTKMHDILDKFPLYFPWHNDKALYGIIAAVDIPDEVKKRVLDAGIYLALIKDDTFSLNVPKGFKAKRFN